jgi:hypothetical protein
MSELQRWRLLPVIRNDYETVYYFVWNRLCSVCWGGIAGSTVPQSVLDENEVYLFLILVVMGWMWLQAFVDVSKGK